MSLFLCRRIWDKIPVQLSVYHIRYANINNVINIQNGYLDANLWTTEMILVKPWKHTGYPTDIEQKRASVVNLNVSRRTLVTHCTPKLTVYVTRQCMLILTTLTDSALILNFGQQFRAFFRELVFFFWWLFTAGD